MITARVVGIDLGTTFSSIATINDNGSPEILPNRDGEEITPSVVMFDGEVPIVGSIAKRSANANPYGVAQLVKRQMGNKAWNFRSASGAKYSSEEISALILKKLKEDAEVLLGEKVVDAVVTVPAYFDDAQRKATQDAGCIAGLNVLRVINEPTAAALAYGLNKSEGDQTILIYDLGGGTFDVTIMKIGGGRLDVLATGGDKNLGGFDWDNQVMTFLNDEFQKAGGSDLFEEPVLEQDVREKAEIAKKTLSARDRTSVFLTGGGKSTTVVLTLGAFQDLTRPLLDRTGRIMQFVLEDAGLQWSQLDKVLLVGGATRMRAVPAMIESICGEIPSCELHPDKVVAMGAAIQGALLMVEAGRSNFKESDDFSLVVVQDVNSHSMGVIVDDDRGRHHNSIVLKKNTPYGVKNEDLFSTVQDGQCSILVQITEGEEEDVSRVSLVGEQKMTIPPYPKGAPIKVSFLYTSDGLVSVEVFDITTGSPLGEIVIKRNNNKTAEQVEASRARVAGIEVK